MGLFDRKPKDPAPAPAPASADRHTRVDPVRLRDGETFYDLNGNRTVVRGGDAHGLMCRDCGCVEGL